MNRGYSQNSDGSLQLWFKPYDAHVPFYQQFQAHNQGEPWGDASSVSSTLARAIGMVDDATIRQSGSYIIWRIKGVTEMNSSNKLMVFAGSLGNPSGNYAGFNLNDSSTRTTANEVWGYDSDDPKNGGRSSAPQSVWVKTKSHSDYDISCLAGSEAPRFTDVQVTPGANPTISYKAGDAQY